MKRSDWLLIMIGMVSLSTVPIRFISGLFGKPLFTSGECIAATLGFALFVYLRKMNSANADVSSGNG
jgi:hypothetical protein